MRRVISMAAAFSFQETTIRPFWLDKKIRMLAILRLEGYDSPSLNQF
jgi:hypothetical protein